MPKAILKHATIWLTIYWAITMIIFCLLGYFICVRFGDSDSILFCMLIYLCTLTVSFSLGYAIFIVIYKYFNKRQH